VRLSGEHRDLRIADPTTTTVTAVAANWGCTHAARFAAFYREQYGVAAIETLRG
jgi:transcriptional regulator GlxA family with amidase domain